MIDSTSNRNQRTRPAEAFGRELLGRLASLGTEKGKPFDPDGPLNDFNDKTWVPNDVEPVQ